MRLRSSTGSDYEAWDELVARSAQGVFLHSRKFLGYHGERFVDHSLVFEDEAGSLRAVFPAAEAPDASRRIISHPGATYGGLVHDLKCDAEEIATMISELCAWYRERDYRAVVYKPVPQHIHRRFAQSDLYALWRCDARLTRRDVWGVIEIDQPRLTSKAHRWRVRRGARLGLVVRELGEEAYPSFHAMVSEGLTSRHGVAPVHSLAELLDIRRRCPEAVKLWGCFAPDDELLAATWVFVLHSGCWHTQYIAATDKGRDVGANDVLIEHLVGVAAANRVAYVSLGASTYDEGRQLNASLFGFKAALGSTVVVQDSYEIAL